MKFRVPTPTLAALALVVSAFSAALWLSAPRQAEAMLCITDTDTRCVIPPKIIINAPGSAYLGPGWYVMTEEITGAKAQVNADGSITLYPTDQVRFGNDQLFVTDPRR